MQLCYTSIAEETLDSGSEKPLYVMGLLTAILRLLVNLTNKSETGCMAVNTACSLSVSNDSTVIKLIVNLIDRSFSFYETSECNIVSKSRCSNSNSPKRQAAVSARKQARGGVDGCTQVKGKVGPQNILKVSQEGDKASSAFDAISTALGVLINLCECSETSRQQLIATGSANMNQH